jgi:hypothetical protein
MRWPAPKPALKGDASQERTFSEEPEIRRASPAENPGAGARTQTKGKNITPPQASAAK